MAIFSHFILAVLLMALSACGFSSGFSGVGNITSLDSAKTECQSGVAEILIGDGFMEILCGCTEAQGTIFPSPGNLSCHLRNPTSTILFLYSGTVLKHRILSVGNPTFLSSPISDPMSVSPYPVHRALVSQSGSIFAFQDSYSGMVGQIFTPPY